MTLTLRFDPILPSIVRLKPNAGLEIKYVSLVA